MHGIQTIGNTAFEYGVVAPRHTVKHDIDEESRKNLSKCIKLVCFFFFPSA